MIAVTEQASATEAEGPPPAPPTAHTLACMEVWGGNGPALTAVSVPGNDVYVACEPWQRGGSGGDIYYVSNCMAGIITRFVLADVAGHGEESDALASSLRRLMRKHINTADQSRFARALNKEFLEISTMGRFATAIIATYYAPTDHLIVCNAGHPRPLWYRASLKQWTLLTPPEQTSDATTDETVGIANLPLGVIEPTSYHQFAVKLGVGDIIVMYTDALMEAKPPGGPQLGECGLLELCRSMGLCDPSEMASSLLAAVKRLTGSALDDDATVLVMGHHAGDPPRQSVGQRARAIGRLIGLGRDG